MRTEFSMLVKGYPRSPVWRDPAFTHSPLVKLLHTELPAVIIKALPAVEGRYDVQGSAGQGGWTIGSERLYLSLNQGCTSLKDSDGIRGAREELLRRAETMWSRISDRAKRLNRIAMDLNVKSSVWRAKLYETGLVAGIQYDAANLPADDVMVADLREALELYSLLNQSGGWMADDDILREAEADAAAAASSLEQAKRYRQHRSIERQRSHSQLVKKKLGIRCMGCLFELQELYGPAAAGFIEAHHLVPLSSLDDNEMVRFNPEKDFAVLCPNCHRVIHRMDDCSDIAGLRRLVTSLAKIRPT